MLLPVAAKKSAQLDWSEACWKVGCCINVVLLIGLVVLGGYSLTCAHNTMAQDSITLPLVKDYQGGQFFKLGNMSTIPAEKWATLSSELMDTWVTKDGFTFGYASADDAPKLLYRGSKVDGVFEKVPEKLQGVYWMRGNPLPEVLAVVQYGQWFEEEQILLLPNAPWTWAWWGGSSSEYPADLDGISKLVYRFASGRSIAESYTEESGLDTVVSFAFEPCPAGMECNEGSGNSSFATLMSHSGGDLSKHGMVYYDGYTMEELDAKDVANPQQRPGSLYFRRAELFCGLFGRGSGYRLTKIIDGEGNPVEPFYGEYQRFMADRPLIVWAGIPDDKLPESAKDTHSTAEE